MADNFKVLDGDGSAMNLRSTDGGSYHTPHHIIDGTVTTSASTTGAQKERFDRYLDTNGNGTGTKEAIGNYATPTKFYIEPPAGTVYRVARMLVTIQDSGTFDADKYGNGVTLTNGVIVQRTINSTTTDMTDGLPIMTNGDWTAKCFDGDVKTWGTGPEQLPIRWTFTKAGQFIRLDGDNNDQFAIVLEDDFTALLKHRFFVQGYIE